MKSICFSAPLSGYFSFSTVASAIINEMFKRGYHIRARDIDPYEDYSLINEDIPRGNDFSPVGIYLGPPWHALECMEGRKIKIGFFVCETDAIPRDMVRICNGFNIVCVPSKWCFNAFSKSGVENSKLRIVNHGVHEDFKPLSDVQKFDKFTFLHLCSATKYLERKGTMDLLYAFDRAFRGNKDIQLKVYRVESEERIFFRSEVMPSAPPSEQARRYNSANVVIAPSRGEGFSLLPLEALACGVSVALTNATGSTEYFPKETPELYGIVEISHKGKFRWGQEAGDGVDLDRKGLLDSLKYCYENREMLSVNALKNAENIRAKWAWSVVLKDFLDELEKLVS